MNEKIIERISNQFQIFFSLLKSSEFKVIHIIECEKREGKKRLSLQVEWNNLRENDKKYQYLRSSI